MKRRQKNEGAVKALSPYAKKKKRPYIYSEETKSGEPLRITQSPPDRDSIKPSRLSRRLDK